MVLVLLVKIGNECQERENSNEQQGIKVVRIMESFSCLGEDCGVLSS